MGNDREKDDRCDRQRQRLSLLVDGELARSERLLLQAHLLGCADCRLFGAEIRGVATTLRDGPLVRPELGTARPRRAARPARPALAAVGFAAVALAAVAVVFLGPAKQPARAGALSPVQGLPVYTTPYRLQGLPVYIGSHGHASPRGD